MTFKHKLARRLAQSHWVRILTVLTPACSATSTAPATTDATPVALRIHPRDVSMRMGSSIDFEAYAIYQSGDSAIVDATWTSTGGMVVRGNGNGNGNGKGQYKPDRPGRHKVKATVDSLQDSVSVDVEAPAVARVEVAPTGAQLTVGGSVTLVATALDSAGAVVASEPVTWTSDNPGVATVDGAGTVTAVSAGNAVITAAAGTGAPGTAGIGVQNPPQGGPYPNQPAGFSSLLEYDASTLQPQGWIFNSRWTNPNYTSVMASDANAGPQSPASTLALTWPLGAEGSTGIATRSFSAQSELYCSHWLKWSDPWDYHNSGVNKIFFISTNEASLNNEMVISLLGTNRSSAAIMMNVQTPSLNGGGPNWYFPPNRTGDGRITLGEWHQIEIHLVGNTGGQSNGVARWWVDGVLVAEHNNVRWNTTRDGRFNQLNFNPVWGGQGDGKSSRDFLYLDHTFCSGRP